MILVTPKLVGTLYHYPLITNVLNDLLSKGYIIKALAGKKEYEIYYVNL